MKAIDFDHNKCSWDEFRRPYMGVGNRPYWQPASTSEFIIFDTGEAIATLAGWKKDIRKTYHDLGVRVFSTADADAPKLYYDTGELVPKAHLTEGGGQDVLLDEVTGIVVGCGHFLPDGGYSGRHKEQVAGRQHDMPSYFWPKRLSVYWPGPGRAPVGSRIKVVRPIKLDDAQRKHIRDLKAAAAAWRAMQDEGAQHKFWAPQPYTYPKEQVIAHRELLKVESFTDMSEALRWKLGAWAVVSNHEEVYVDRLKVKE